MRIVHLAAGAGTMYCGACARDAALMRGLCARGHDVQIIPLYTPLRMEGPDPVPLEPVFLGGINAYLQQVSGIFRHTPRFLDRMFDHEGLLRWASGFAVRTDPRDLGPMTVSVLSGRHGRQVKEVDRLIAFLCQGPRPDVVSITNSLLSGVAPAIREALGVPIVCGLQGEESFVGAMPEPWRTRAQASMRGNAASVDLYLSPGVAYAATMARYLDVPASRIALVRAGIDPAPYAGPRPPQTRRTVGALGVITRPKGLDRLVRAFAAAAGNRADVVLRIAGKDLDPRFAREVRRQVAEAGLGAQVEFVGELDLAAKARFLRECTVFVSPTRVAESRGVSVMEAMASGTPVIVPASGVFPEMTDLTEGGLLVAPDDEQAMAGAIVELLDDPVRAEAMGRAGRDGICRHFSADAMVEQALTALGAVIPAAG